MDDHRHGGGWHILHGSGRRPLGNAAGNPTRENFMNWESPILRVAAVVGALGIIGTFFLATLAIATEFQVVQSRTVDHEIRWLLQDKHNAVQALRNAKSVADQLYWKQKVEAIQIQISQLKERDRRR